MYIFVTTPLTAGFVLTMYLQKDRKVT